MAISAVPDHVPPHLVVDLDIYDLPGASDDPQRAWLSFRGHGPIVWSPHNGGHWVATEGADVAAFFRDHRRFSSSSVTIPSVPADPLLPLEADPPIHGEYRRAVMTYLTPARVRGLEAEIRALTGELIDGFLPDRGCEFIGDFAHRLPLIIVLRLMDLPLADRTWLHARTEIFARHPDLDAKITAYGEVRAYLDARIAERRSTPGDDLISHLLSAKIDGRPMDAGELLSTCTMVTFAGLDTVAAMFGFIALFLARQPEMRRAILADPDRMPAVVPELLRRYATSNMGRVLAEDVVHGAVTMKRGDHIMLSPSLHNLDPALFPDPERIDFDRPPRHISFGSGAHTCAGAQLARMEVQIFIEEWLRRIPDFAVAPGAAVPARAGPVNTIDHLPLVWPAP
ncbi:MAG: cytochrome P450 [Pseudomonadota bacterium]